MYGMSPLCSGPEKELKPMQFCSVENHKDMQKYQFLCISHRKDCWFYFLVYSHTEDTLFIVPIVFI